MVTSAGALHRHDSLRDRTAAPIGYSNNLNKSRGVGTETGGNGRVHVNNLSARPANGMSRQWPSWGSGSECGLTGFARFVTLC
jgi:hypothetical protein